LQDIDESETIELPLWLAEPLHEGRIGIVDLPPSFSARVRDQLLADPTAVRLRDLSPFFYETGLRLADLCSGEDAQRLPSSIKACLASRVSWIVSRAQASVGCDVSAFVDALTNLEQQLFWQGYQLVRDRLAWRKRKTGILRASGEGGMSAAAAYSSGGVLGIGSASGVGHRQTKRVRTGY
jgi:GINS complex subunit 3